VFEELYLALFKNLYTSVIFIVLPETSIDLTVLELYILSDILAYILLCVCNMYYIDIV